MPKFNVHLFPIVRVKVTDVEADSAEAAVPKAEELVGADLHRIFSQEAPLDTEYSEEMSHFLVDVVGDEEYQQSKWFVPTTGGEVVAMPQSSPSIWLVAFKSIIAAATLQGDKLTVPVKVFRGAARRVFGSSDMLWGRARTKSRKQLQDRKPPTRIVVILEEGLVRGVISEVPVEVLVKDVDEGAAEGDEDAVVYTRWEEREVEVSPETVAKEFGATMEEEDHAP